MKYELSIDATRAYDRSVILTGAQWKKVEAVLEAAYWSAETGYRDNNDLCIALGELFPNWPQDQP